MNQLVLTYQLPAIEVHATKFSIVWLSNVNVKRLALVNVCTTICCHLEDRLLGDFPHSFIQLFQIIWDLINVLKRRGTNSHFICSPQVKLGLIIGTIGAVKWNN